MSKVNQTVDSQALNFGVVSANASANQQAIMATGSLSATAAGPPPTATLAYNSPNTNDLAGQVLITNTNATWHSGSPIFGTILSNTKASPSVATVDGWWKCADFTAAGASPATTSDYVVFPAQAPFWVIGLSSDTTTVVGTETGTGITNELTGNGLQRVICTTFTHTASASTGTLGKIFTYGTNGNQAIGRSFISNSLTAAGTSGRGNFLFFLDVLNGTFGYNVASSGDTLQVTYTITFATVP